MNNEWLKEQYRIIEYKNEREGAHILVGTETTNYKIDVEDHPLYDPEDDYEGNRLVKVTQKDTDEFINYTGSTYGPYNTIPYDINRWANGVIAEAERLYKPQQQLNKLLISACEKGNLQELKERLNRGTNIEARDIYGNTPLLTAAWYSRPEVVKELLNRGADIEARNNYSDTPLLIAARHGRTEIVKELLDRGANVNTKDVDGRTALTLARERGYSEVIKLLEVQQQQQTEQESEIKRENHGQDDSVKRIGELERHIKHITQRIENLEKQTKTLEEINKLHLQENSKLKEINEQMKEQIEELKKDRDILAKSLVTVFERFDQQSMSLLERGGVDEQSRKFLEEHKLELRDVIDKAFRDQLTGLHNRNYLEFVMTHNEGRYVGMVMDIDHFKKINDTHGHAYGDSVLKTVGETIKDTAKEYGDGNREIHVFRLGGEEVGVLTRVRGDMRYDQSEELRFMTQFAEQIRTNVEKTGLCTVSVGISDRDMPLPVKDYKEVDLDKVFGDKNLYLSKQQGRNRVTGPQIEKEPQKSVDIER
jgi:diguanylate cyclase (GGDEF)-like protein